MILKMILKLNKMKTIFLICFALVLSFGFAFTGTAAADAAAGAAATDGNIVVNHSFEDDSGANMSNWDTYIWDKNPGVTEIKPDSAQSHSGSASIMITNNTPNDARLLQDVPVQGDSYYKLSCWVKTEGVGPDNKGANISIAGLLAASKDVRGTSAGWEYIELYGKTRKGQSSFTLTLGLGGYGSTNTGKAWFDDAGVQKIDSLPESVTAVNLYSEDSSQGKQGSQGSQNKQGSPYANQMVIYCAIYFILIFAVYAKFRRIKKKDLLVRNDNLYMAIILSLAVFVRVALANWVEGFPTDMACFKGWASAVANDLPGFYTSGMFCDYPPFYLYILFIVGKLAKLQIPGVDFTLLVKLPSIFADAAISYMLYRVASKKTGALTALFIAGAFAFNPASILETSVWGMMDSFFTAFLVLAFILMIKGRLDLASIVMTCAVLMKPQAVFFLPILLYELIRKKDVKMWALSAIYSVITLLVIILPFSPGQDPLWIINLYMKTASTYTSASLNAFSLFALLGANLKDDSSSFLFLNYNKWGLIFDALILAFSALIYFKAKKRVNPVFIAILLNVGVFMLSSRMHERYMYPVIALALLLAAYTGSRKILGVYAAATATIFVNVHIVLHRVLALGSPHVPPDDPILLLVSFINLLILIYVIKLSLLKQNAEVP